jgi:hypothetical protein
MSCREIVCEVGARRLRIEGAGINKVSGKQNFCIPVKKRN